MKLLFMKNSIIPNDVEKRVRWLITWTWEILAHKIGNDLIEVNKEATLQLEYAYLLTSGS